MSILTDINLSSGTNYVEIYLVSPINTVTTNDNHTMYNTNLDPDMFFRILASMKKNSQDVKFFQKEYKEYTVNDIICQIYSQDNETKVFKKKPNNVEYNDKKHLLVLSHNKNKLTMLNFPSTKNVNQITYSKALIFRISNRIYLNFVISINEQFDDQKTYNIYINYNHDSNVDLPLINKSITQILDILN